MGYEFHVLCSEGALEQKNFFRVQTNFDVCRFNKVEFVAFLTFMCYGMFCIVRVCDLLPALILSQSRLDLDQVICGGFLGPLFV